MSLAVYILSFKQIPNDVALSLFNIDYLSIFNDGCFSCTFVYYRTVGKVREQFYISEYLFIAHSGIKSYLNIEH